MSLISRTFCLTVVLVLLSPGLQAKSVINNFEQLVTHLKARGGEDLRLKAYQANLGPEDEWRNPTLTLEGLGKAKKLEPRTEYSVSLSQPIELGGKREARRMLRKAAAQTSALETEQLIADKVLRTLELTKEIEEKQSLDNLYEEALHSFEAILKRLDKLPGLSFEKQIEKEALELAVADHQFKHDFLESTLKELRLERESLLGKETDLDSKVVTSFFAMSAPSDQTKLALAMRLNQSKVSLFESDVKLQKSSLWPDLEVGATVSELKENSVTDRRFGLSLSFDLPLWNRNSREITRANLELGYAKQSQLVGAQSLKNELQSNRIKLAILKKSIARNERSRSLEARHQKAEELFKKGVISTGLIIEVHRQLIELRTSLAEAELEYLQTFWRVQMLSGNLQLL